jgi:hypothetical protein
VERELFLVYVEDEADDRRVRSHCKGREEGDSVLAVEHEIQPSADYSPKE